MVVPPLDRNVFAGFPMAKQGQARRAVQRACPEPPSVRAADLLVRLFAPTAAWWVTALRTSSESERPLVVSVSGMPGTGKSTLVRAVSALMEHVEHLRVAGFSLDDIYLPRLERLALARRVHPLLSTRGVPGTHEVELGMATVQALRHAREASKTPLPRFDKLSDDRVERSNWPVFSGRPDVIVLDGWCFATVPGDPRDLAAPLNGRERSEDPQGVYRRFVHEQLAGPYQQLFALSSYHLHLAAPSHAASIRWRIEQGKAALARKGRDSSELDEAGIARFVDLFQRVGQLPRRPGPELLARLDEDHRVASLDLVTR